MVAFESYRDLHSLCNFSSAALGEDHERKETALGGQPLRAELRGGRFEAGARHHLVVGQRPTERHQGNGEL